MVEKESMDPIPIPIFGQELFGVILEQPRQNLIASEIDLF
jgi:hypothetical protein